MAICRTCGRGAEDVTDAEIMAALRSHEGAYLYARGLPHGGADYNSWHITRGLLSGTLIPHSQVKRLVESGQLVPYGPGLDCAFCTPEEHQRLDDLLYAREAKRRAKAPPA